MKCKSSRRFFLKKSKDVGEKWRLGKLVAPWKASDAEKPGIMDLPNELLLRIFRRNTCMFRDWEPIARTCTRYWVFHYHNNNYMLSFSDNLQLACLLHLIIWNTLYFFQIQFPYEGQAPPFFWTLGHKGFISKPFHLLWWIWMD